MDHLSSTDLETTSKTPLFLGIAAVILAVVGLVLGWLGFSKSSALEGQLAEFSAVSATVGQVAESSDVNATQLAQMATGFADLRQDIGQALKEIESDISGNKRNLRSVAIQAGTALKKVEEIEANGIVRSATAPKPSGSVSAKGAAAEPDEGQVYRIKSGDTFSAIASRAKISLSRLIAANPGIDYNRLRIGQEIVIPAGN